MRNSTKAMVAGGLSLGNIWTAFYINSITPYGWWGNIPLFITAIVLFFILGAITIGYIDKAEEDARKLRDRN